MDDHEIERFLDTAQRLPELAPGELGQLGFVALPGVVEFNEGGGIF